MTEDTMEMNQKINRSKKKSKKKMWIKTTERNRTEPGPERSKPKMEKRSSDKK